MADKPIEVAAGLVFRDGKLLITKRPEGGHLAGLWEFPGGKREANETIERCLHRELKEELGIEVALAKRWNLDAQVLCYDCTNHLLLARLAKGEPRAIECADLEWVTRENLAKFQFPPADQRLISRLVDDPSFWE